MTRDHATTALALRPLEPARLSHPWMQGNIDALGIERRPGCCALHAEVPVWRTLWSGGYRSDLEVGVGPD